MKVERWNFVEEGTRQIKRRGRGVNDSESCLFAARKTLFDSSSKQSKGNPRALRLPINAKQYFFLSLRHDREIGYSLDF